jgi:RND family efflux transporter MFP subunit
MTMKQTGSPIRARRGCRLLAGLCLTALLTGCSAAQIQQPTLPPATEYQATYPLVTVVRGDLVQTEQIACQYQAASSETLSFPEDGKAYAGVYVTLGQTVKAGDLVAELSLESTRTQIESLEYDIRVLEVKSYYLWQNRALELELCDVKQSSQAQREAVILKYRDQLQSIEDSLTVKRLRLQAQQEILQAGLLYASMDGVVTQVHDAAPGDLTIAHQTVATVSDLSSTAFTVTGDKAAYFPVGTQVAILCGSKTYAAVSAEAEAMGLEPAENTAYFQLAQPDPSLKSGATGTIEITLETRKDVLYIPKTALHTAEDKTFVYTLDENGLKTLQYVTTGFEAQAFVQITQGLTEGQAVITQR